MKYTIINTATYEVGGMAVAEFSNGKKINVEWSAGRECGRPFYIRGANGTPLWSEELQAYLSSEELKELSAVLNSTKLYCSEDDYLEVV